MTEEVPEADLDRIRKDVAREYHRVLIDLAMKGEASVGTRRFWRTEEGVIEWRDDGE